jgi:hypothetical protein
MNYQLYRHKMSLRRKLAISFVSVVIGSATGVLIGLFIISLQITNMAANVAVNASGPFQTTAQLKVEPLNPKDQALTVQGLQPTVDDSRLQ